MYVSAKDKAKKIRAALKKIGLSSRQVSVRCESAGYSDAINITINDIGVDIADVNKIAAPFDAIDRDQRTGEILAGGNTYIFTQYAYTVLEGAKKAVLPLSQRIFAGKEKLDNLTICDGVAFAKKRYAGQVHSADDVADVIVQRRLIDFQ